jgi:hypothetical protein
MIFMDESMDEFYFKRWEQMLILQKIEHKIQGGNNLCWFISKKNSTNEMLRSHFKVILHISLI